MQSNLPSPDELVDQAEAAVILDTAERTLSNWRGQGKGPRYIKIGERMVRYRRADLAAFIAGDETYKSRLTDLRQRAGMTAQEFADAVGGRVLKKGTLFDQNSAPCARIAKRFDVSPVWLDVGSDAPKSFWPDWWNPEARAAVA